MSDRYLVHHRLWDETDVREDEDGAIWRSVTSSDVEIHRVELASGGRTTVPVRPGTWTIQVLSGEVTLVLLGNELSLDPGAYAMIPPNLSFSITATGRRGSTVCLVHCRAGRS